MTKRKPVNGYKFNRVDLLPGSHLTCYYIPNFLSQKRCEQLLKLAKKSGFQLANTKYPPSYRNNARLETDNPLLAKKLFDEASPYLPRELDENHECSWELSELNPRIRYCRYSAEEFFSTHKDGVFHQSHRSESKLTFIVYLNDSSEFIGGRTLFYKHQNDLDPIAEYSPKTGDLMVFDHDIWHCGELVKSGVKYILRSDLIYRKKTQISSEILQQHSGYIWSSCKLPFGKIATAGRDKTIRVWDKTLSPMHVLESHQYSVLDIDSDKSGNIFSVSRDGYLIKWSNDKSGYTIEYSINTHHSTVLSVLCLEQGSIITSGADGKILHWSEDGKLLGEFGKYKSWVWKTAVVNRELIASCSEDGSIHLLNLSSGVLTSEVDLNSGPIRCIHFNKINQKLYAGNNNGEVFEVDIETELKVKRSWKIHTSIVRDITSSVDGTLITCSEDNTVKIVDIQNSTVDELYQHKNFVTSLMMNENTVFSTSYDGTIQSRSFTEY